MLDVGQGERRVGRGINVNSVENPLVFQGVGTAGDHCEGGIFADEVRSALRLNGNRRRQGSHAFATRSGAKDSPYFRSCQGSTVKANFIHESLEINPGKWARRP